VTEGREGTGVGEIDAVLVPAGILGCPACEVVRSLTGRRRTSATTGHAFEYVDDEVVVLRPRRPELDEIVVLPCRHVAGLTELPSPALGGLLAALRRVCLWAEERCLVPRARVEETHRHPASEGHVCFRLVPAPKGTAPSRTSA